MMSLRGPGSYVLILRLIGCSELAVGRLGMLRLPAGHYAYVGSALAGLQARLARHMRRDKRHHWHIDYLLDVAEIVEAWAYLGPERVECQWAALLSKQLEPAARGFGSSDCRCPTHLFYSAALPSLACFRARQPERPVRRLEGTAELT